MRTEKMLAVRLQTDLVDEVRKYAAENNKTIKAVIEDFIERGLADSSNYLVKRNWTTDVRKKLYEEHLQAIQSGKIPYWSEKKMLAVRLPSTLIQALADYAKQRQQNINICLEAFILLQLNRQKGEASDTDILSQIHYFPFRKRRGESTH